MRRILILLLVIVSSDLMAQSKYNEPRTISKEEFQELSKYRDNFVPVDLGDTVVIVLYSEQTNFNLQKKARNLSFAQNGTDTTNLKDEAWMDPDELKKFMSMGKRLQKDAGAYKKAFEKKGIYGLIVEENELTKKPRYKKMYWFKTVYISSQKSFDDLGWVMTVTQVFYDPRTGKEFEMFLPANYGLLALIKDKEK